MAREDHKEGPGWLWGGSNPKTFGERALEVPEVVTKESMVSLQIHLSH